MENILSFQSFHVLIVKGKAERAMRVCRVHVVCVWCVCCVWCVYVVCVVYTSGVCVCGVYVWCMNGVFVSAFESTYIPTYICTQFVAHPAHYTPCTSSRVPRQCTRHTLVAVSRPTKTRPSRPPLLAVQRKSYTTVN